MNRSLWLLIFCLLMSVALSGCNISGEVTGDLKDIEPVAALAVDKSADEICAQVSLLHRDCALERRYASSYYHLKANGESLAAAVGNLADLGARQVNFAHAGLLVLGEQAADPTNWLDFALLSAQIRPNIYPVVAQGQAGALLADAAAELSPVYLLANALEPWGDGYAGAWAVSLHDFLTALYQPGIAAALPYAAKTADGGIQVAGLAVFAVDSWQHIADGDSTLAWRLLVRPQQVRGQVLTLDDGTSVSLLAVRVSPTAVGSALSFDIKVKAKLQENTPNLLQGNIEDELAAYLQNALQNAVSQSRQTGLDFLGLGRELWRRQPAVWAKLANTDYLGDITVNFRPVVSVQQTAV